MKTTVWLLCFFAVVPTFGDSREEVESRIETVTVYADRARVTRTAQVRLRSRPTAFVFPSLPGWIDKGSVRVDLESTSAGRILGVQVERTFLARPSDDEFREAERAVEEIQDQISILDDEAAVLDAESKHIAALQAFSVDKLPDNAAVRRITIDELEESVTFVTESLRRVAGAKRELALERRQLEPELAVRQRRLGELQQRARLDQRTIVVTASTSNGESASAVGLTVTYLIPGATWEPSHELRTSSFDAGTNETSISSFANIRQTSGEDWSSAKLSLSTQRSSQTLRIPEIQALHIGGGRTLSRAVNAGADSFDSATANYSQQNAAFFDAMNSDLESQQAYRHNQAVQFDNARRVAEIFQQLETRGTTAHFAAIGPQSIPSDGRNVRVPIGDVQLSDLSHRTIAAPEASLNAIRILDLTNEGQQPLLPGKVSLYVEGAFLGLTDLDFIAPSEDFELFLGVADHLKISRSLDRQSSTLSRRGERTKVNAAFLVRIENLSTLQSELIQLHDRIPVSRTDQIRITGVEISPTGQLDSDSGLLLWNVSLAPRETKFFRIEYTVEYPTNLRHSTGTTTDLLRSKLMSIEDSLQE